MKESENLNWKPQPNWEPYVPEWKRTAIRLLENLKPRLQAIDSTLSIIIQGPLNERLKESIPIYLQLIKQSRFKQSGNLVISFWENDNKEIIKEFTKEPLITFVENSYDDLPKYEKSIGTRGAAPWVFQNYTTAQGLKKATGKISIKVRSDEIYPNLKPFKDAVLKNGSLFHTSDIFFRKDEEEKFHISDHIIASSTVSMERAFSIAVEMCVNNYPLMAKFPEQLICIAILRSKNIDYSKKYKSKKIMKENFRIIPISRLGEAIWTCSYRRYRPIRETEVGWLQNIERI